MPLNNTQQHFSTVLASTIHDLKNSLGTLQNLISEVAKNSPHNDPNLVQLEFEVKRMNHSMMQLLALYRIDSNKFSLDIDEYSAGEILEEVQAQQAPQFHMSQKKLALNCPGNLMAYCDFIQISNALGTILNNAQRYSRNNILLSAGKEGDYVYFAIEDDGAGFPENLLSINSADPQQMDWTSGNTGLGLYFSSTIAALHQNHGKSGYIRIDNESSLGGARFRLFLP